MDSNHISGHHEWINFKLGWTYFIQSRCPVEESLERQIVLHVLILNECDVCKHIISISSMEMGIHPSIDTCMLQDAMGDQMGDQVQGGLWVNM